MTYIDDILAGATEHLDIRRDLPPDVAAARRREKSNRSSEAHNRALRALKATHLDEFEDYKRRAAKNLDETRGPLPGDEEM